MRGGASRDWVDGTEDSCPHREALTHTSPTDGVKVDIEERSMIFKRLHKRNDEIELLEAYSKYLMEHGYLDTDWKDEPPYAIDEFLKTRG